LKKIDIDTKLKNYLKIKGIINNLFRPQKVLKDTRIKLPALVYGSENWNIKARDARRRIRAADMKYMKQQNAFGQIIKHTQRMQKI